MVVTQIISVSAVKIMWTDPRTIYEIKVTSFFDYFDLKSDAEGSINNKIFICMLFLSIC